VHAPYAKCVLLCARACACACVMHPSMCVCVSTCVDVCCIVCSIRQTCPSSVELGVRAHMCPGMCSSAVVGVCTCAQVCTTRPWLVCAHVCSGMYNKAVVGVCTRVPRYVQQDWGVSRVWRTTSRGCGVSACSNAKVMSRSIDQPPPIRGPRRHKAGYGHAVQNGLPHVRS